MYASALRVNREHIHVSVHNLVIFGLEFSYAKICSYSAEVNLNFELEIFQLHTTPGLDLHTDHTQGWLRLVEEEEKISVGGCASVFQINIPNTRLFQK